MQNYPVGKELTVKLGIAIDFAYWVILHAFVVLFRLFKIFFQEHSQMIKWFGSRSGPMISKQQKMLLTSKELNTHVKLSIGV